MKFIAIYAICFIAVCFAAKECKKNEELVAVHNNFEPLCGYTPKFATKQALLNYCDCKKGFVRNTNGECVDPIECTDKTTKCPENETFRQCGTACEPTCQNPAPTVCTKQCILNVCQCSSGFVRHNDMCIKKEECPK